MSKKPKKYLKEYHSKELGINVIIQNVPVIDIEGHEVYDIDFDKVGEIFFAHLILKPHALTGAEVRFMRLFMGLTIEVLANCLHVTHPTVISWEKCGEDPTKMTNTTEAMLRIYAARHGAKDYELIQQILEKFFIGPKKDTTLKKSQAIIELSPYGIKDLPKVKFTSLPR